MGFKITAEEQTYGGKSLRCFWIAKPQIWEMSAFHHSSSNVGLDPIFVLLDWGVKCQQKAAPGQTISSKIPLRWAENWHQWLGWCKLSQQKNCKRSYITQLALLKVLQCTILISPFYGCKKCNIIQRNWGQNTVKYYIRIISICLMKMDLDKLNTSGTNVQIPKLE